ncbi:MAG: hypothetical protein IH897_05530 [Planctomycetes bacterium]|nr:hypothetical protein [Planctomycetota bacterium]
MFNGGPISSLRGKRHHLKDHGIDIRTVDSNVKQEIVQILTTSYFHTMFPEIVDHTIQHHAFRNLASATPTRRHISTVQGVDGISEIADRNGLGLCNVKGILKGLPHFLKPC